MPKPPVERTRKGFALHLDAEERALLGRLLDDLRNLIATEADSPALQRLFPVAYHLDPEADAEYQRLMREELVASRLSAMDGVTEALERGRLSDEEITPFMQSLNSLRLVLGTLLDVDEDADPDGIDPDDPQAPEQHLYGFLSWLLDWTIRAQQA